MALRNDTSAAPNTLVFSHCETSNNTKTKKKGTDFIIVVFPKEVAEEYLGLEQ